MCRSCAIAGLHDDFVDAIRVSIGVSLTTRLERKLRAPVLVLIVKRLESAPPSIEYVIVCAGRSPSVAVTVVIAVVFSAMLMLAVSAPPLLVMIGF